jgi:hypothetical protein
LGSGEGSKPLLFALEVGEARRRRGRDYGGRRLEPLKYAGLEGCAALGGVSGRGGPTGYDMDCKTQLRKETQDSQKLVNEIINH